MIKVLCANYKIRTEPLAERLKGEGFEVEDFGSDIDGDIPIRKVSKAFWREFRPRLNEYDVLIAHLGRTFGSEVNHLLYEFPRLKIAIVTNLPRDYKMVDDSLDDSERKRFLTCGYESKHLIDFIKNGI